MPSVRKDVIAHRLIRRARLGVIVRVHLTPSTYRTIQSLRKKTGRTLADIFRIILAPVVRDRDFVGPVPRHEKTRVVNIRMPRHWSTILQDLAWEQNASKARLIGHATDQFLRDSSSEEIAHGLSNQLDRVGRIVRSL